MSDLSASFEMSNPIAGLEEDIHVTATEPARDLLRSLQSRHGAISLHHQGGYASGTETMCLPLGELRTGDGDILLGVVEGVPIFVYGRNVRDWDDRQFVLDAITSTTGSYSLDSGTGRRFFVRSKPFDAIVSTGHQRPAQH